MTADGTGELDVLALRRGEKTKPHLSRKWYEGASILREVTFSEGFSECSQSFCEEALGHLLVVVLAAAAAHAEGVGAAEE